jgi:hypothetical protein
MPRGAKKRHGHSTREQKSPTYNSWRDMIRRCENDMRRDYRYYGGRGIKVCLRWHTFDLFLEDMGPRPKGATIDRINPNGDYELENCRWLAKRKQNRNTRATVWLTLGNVRLSLAEWAERLDMPYNCLRIRVQRGWPDERVLTTPVNPNRSAAMKAALPKAEARRKEQRDAKG